LSLLERNELCRGTLREDKAEGMPAAVGLDSITCDSSFVKKLVD
jgi:hypothetical protein